MRIARSSERQDRHRPVDGDDVIELIAPDVVAATRRSGDG